MSRPSAGFSLLEVAERFRHRQMAAASGGGLKPLPKKGPTPVLVAPLTANDPRPRAAGREACPRCGTRGDLGCAHYAPCSPGNLPRRSAGILNENATLSRGARHHG